MSADRVAHVVEQWRVERPDLDPGPMLVVGRVQRLAQLVEVALRRPFAEAGLGQGDFDVLAALRRAGSPYSRTPGELRDALLVTSGAITKQVDRLLAKGLVTRTVDADDARGRRVALTEPGLTLIDALIATHLDNERRLLTPLSKGQRDGLAAALAVLIEQMESWEDGAPPPRTESAAGPPAARPSR